MSSPNVLVDSPGRFWSHVLICPISDLLLKKEAVSRCEMCSVPWLGAVQERETNGGAAASELMVVQIKATGATIIFVCSGLLNMLPVLIPVVE